MRRTPPGGEQGGDGVVQALSVKHENRLDYYSSPVLLYLTSNWIRYCSICLKMVA